MGLLRMLLALSVLTAHMHGKSILGFRLLYGNLAVQCFFMVSGFYMALVLNEKYNRPGDYIPFLWQRLLRLFPAYLVVLVLTLLIELLISWCAGQPLDRLISWFDHAHMLSFSTWVVLISSNLFLIGQEINLFQAIDPVTGNLYFTGRFMMDPIPATPFILVGQAWTLSLEFIFYAMAPLLVRRSAWIQIVVVAISVILRVTTSWMIDPHEHPWHGNHFFPYELAFFMAGSVGYQIYRHQKVLLERLTGFIIWFRWVFLIGMLYYSRLPGTSYTREAIFIPLLFLMIPALFYHTKNNTTDRFIGELSYPFYLIHALILFLMRPWVPLYFVPDPDGPLSFLPSMEGPLYAIIVIGCSYLLYRFVDEKVDNFRHRLFAQRRVESAPSA